MMSFYLFLCVLIRLIPQLQAVFIFIGEIMNRTCASQEDVDLSLDVSPIECDTNYSMDHFVHNISNGINC